MPTTQEIAEDLVAMCKRGEFDASGEKYWADDVVSLEAAEGDMARVEGKAGARGKGAWWAANHEVHDSVVEGPYVNGHQFVVRFKMDLTPKGASGAPWTRWACTPSRTARSSKSGFSTARRRRVARRPQPAALSRNGLTFALRPAGIPWDTAGLRTRVTE